MPGTGPGITETEAARGTLARVAQQRPFFYRLNF
jgi:hypothetical protein